MKIFYLNNPVSGNKNGEKYFGLIKKELTDSKIEFDSAQTEYAGHGTEIIQRLNFEEYDALAVSGGDGTLYELINGYFNNKASKKLPVCVIPIGRGNAFARDLGLTTANWKDSIQSIIKDERRFVDVASFTNGGIESYFVNILGAGFVTDVANTAFKLRVFGHLSYILGILYRITFLKPYTLKLIVDGKELVRENIFIEVSNTKYTGKDFFMAPNAIMDDGYLDITLLNKLSRMKALECLPKIFTGEHIKMKEVECIRAKEISIETNPVKALTPDGQLLGSTPLQIKCMHKAIEVYYKKNHSG